MVFGWENDNGIGEKLIQQILIGEKTATCAPKEEYSEDELEEMFEPVGKVFTVFDKEGNARCNVKLKEVFETTFGNPDLRLVRGEGNGEDIKTFQEEHKAAWQNIGIELKEETVLVVELFELADGVL